MNISPVKVVAALLLWILFTAIALGAYAWQWLNAERDMYPIGYVYQVEKGASLHSVAEHMHSRGALHWPKVWVLYAKFYNLTNIKAGEYTFKEMESPISILKKINEGKTSFYNITLVEGGRFKDFLATLHNHDKIEKTLTLENALAKLQDAGVNVDHIEGWFYPDTFQFSAGDTDLSVLVRAHEKMKYVLSRHWLKRDKKVPYKNAYEALIMASIVEKETGVDYEREEIAGVFSRRLQKGMRLQTDPTVIYGMGDAYKGNITRRDLRTRTPYNTYLIKGLPPTPIAMPGTAAIYATLHPKAGDTLFFVAKGDGTHHFSATLEEHNRAVNEYQKKRRKDYRSAPPESTSPVSTSSAKEAK